MPRPTTKSELVDAAAEGFAGLMRLVDAMSGEEREATFAFEDRDRNVRDVLVHLSAWHHLLTAWIRSNLGGVPRPFLPEPYTWKTYGQMNVEIMRAHRSTSVAEAREEVAASHADAMEVIGALDDTQLFTRGCFDWTGSTTLGSYCVSATSSHYAWAAKKLRRHRRTFTA